jgi:hypothetical protein
VKKKSTEYTKGLWLTNDSDLEMFKEEDRTCGT